MKYQHGDYSKGKELIWKDGIDFILAQYHIAQKMTILDVGCGDGSFLRFLRREAEERGIAYKNVEYYGIDIAEEYKDLAMKEGVRFTTGDALELERYYKKEFFDIVIASEILEHVDKTDRIISSIRKILKKDGYLYLTTPNLASWHSRIMLLLGYQPLATEVSNERADFGKGWFWKFYGGKEVQPIHHVRCFTYKALLDFFKYYGFKIVKQSGGGYRKGEKILWKLFPFLTSVIQLICKKI